MATIADNLQQVRARIASACAAAGRPVQSVTLLAVSKTFARRRGARGASPPAQRRFGENYVQEALDKIAALADLRARIEWHLIGPLQSNKTRVVAERFDWVHTVDRLKIAERLSRAAPRRAAAAAGVPAGQHQRRGEQERRRAGRGRRRWRRAVARAAAACACAG